MKLATPSRRRGTFATAPRTARNLALANAVLAQMSRSRPGRRRRRRINLKVLTLGGGGAALLAGVLLGRDKLAAVLPARGRSAGHGAPPPPQPSDLDVSSPRHASGPPVRG
jgi:hypothetical protein